MNTLKIQKSSQPFTEVKPSLEASLQRIASAIEEYSREEKGGLLTGLSGMSLFMAYYGRYSHQVRYRRMAEEMLEQAFDSVQRQWHPVSLCSGVPGILWSADHLQQQGLIDIDYDATAADDFLLTEMINAATRNDFDFLHGAGGLLFYFINRKNGIEEAFLDRVIALLQQHAVSEGEGKLSWKSYIDIQQPKLVRNLSLSHGMSSMVIILCQAYRRYRLRPLEDLIRGAILFLLSCKNKASGLISIFPGAVGDIQSDENSRLGWCYGDLGVALALLKAGATLSEYSWTSEALRILEHASYRRDLKQNHILDAGLCHGAAGIAHIFNRVYQQVSEKKFLEAARYWFRQSLKMEKEESYGLAGYQAFNGITGWKDEMQLLEGIAGIGLAYLGAVDTNAADWDQCLLIS